MTREEVIICKSYLNDLDRTHDCNEYKLLMALLDREPCEDAVSRQAVLDMAEDMTDQFGNKHRVVTEGLISMLPPATSTRKKGKWIKHDTGHSIYYDCSLCGCAAPCTETADKILWKLSNYCPDCGAEMENEE